MNLPAEQAVETLLRRRDEARSHIRAAASTGDRADAKAWRTVFSRINDALSAAGWRYVPDDQHKPVEKAE